MRVTVYVSMVMKYQLDRARVRAQVFVGLELSAPMSAVVTVTAHQMEHMTNARAIHCGMAPPVMCLDALVLVPSVLPMVHATVT